jgi:hypothetical protein
VDIDVAGLSEVDYNFKFGCDVKRASKEKKPRSAE